MITIKIVIAIAPMQIATFASNFISFLHQMYTALLYPTHTFYILLEIPFRRLYVLLILFSLSNHVCQFLEQICMDHFTLSFPSLFLPFANLELLHLSHQI